MLTFLFSMICLLHLVVITFLYSFYFIYGSFNSTLNISVYFKSNDVVVSECWNGRDVIVV